MKKLLPLCALLTGMFFSITSCSNEDNPSEGFGPNGAGNIPQEVINQFNQDYPEAQNVKWDVQNDGHYTVDFKNQKGNNTAWYSNWGEWDMTRAEIPFNALPDAVMAAFEDSSYETNSGWLADNEVDMLIRNGNETLYVIEVTKRENGIETEVDLYFTANGVLVKEIADSEPGNNYHEYLPQQPAGNIQAWLANSKYNNAGIVDIERENGGTEVELIHNGQKVEILFSASQQWIYTKTEYKRKDQHLLPEALLNAVRQSAEWASGYNRLEDVDFYETAQNGNYYSVELEGTFDRETELYFTENGTPIDRRPNPGTGSGQGGSIPVETDIQLFIEEHYAGAIIIEKEYDHGLLEVEIWHENTEKTVKFNGRNEWIRTEWEEHTLSEVVKAALESAGYRIADNDFNCIQTPEGKWYEVEAYRNGREWEVSVDESGNILSERRDD